MLEVDEATYLQTDSNQAEKEPETKCPEFSGGGGFGERQRR